MFYPLVSVGRLVHGDVNHRFSTRTDGNLCIYIPSLNQFCLYPIYFLWVSLLSFREFAYLPIAEWIVRAKTSARIFSDVAQIRLICLICSLISGVTALHRAHIKIQLSGRSLPVSYCVLLGNFTFELQSESSFNRFHVSLFLYSMLVLVSMKLLIFKTFSNT